MASVTAKARIAVLASLLASPALAQQGVEQFDPGQFFIGDVRAYCGDFEVYMLPKADTLIDSPNISRININAPVFNSLPIGLQLFAYYQTCGIVFWSGDVTKADASAARIGAGKQWLSADDVDQMCTTDVMVKAGWKYAPDAARCDAIKETMQKTLQQ
jgi:hypothetical protein